MTSALLALSLVAKDLRIEVRARRVSTTIAALGVLIVAVLGIGLGPGRGADGVTASAILWIAYLFGGILCFESTMAVERQDDALASLLMAPLDRSVIYFAKFLTNLVLMLGMALIVTPVAVVFFEFDLSAAPVAFIRIMLASIVGVAALGTLFSAAVTSGRGHGGLLAVMVFPLCLPLVLTSTRLLAQAFGTGAHGAGSGELILLAFDVVYLAASWLAFHLILEP